MNQWRSPAVIVTTVAAVVAVGLLAKADHDRRRAQRPPSEACRQEPLPEDCKDPYRQGGPAYYGGYNPGYYGYRGGVRPAPGLESTRGAAPASTEAAGSGTRRSGFGATGRSYGSAAA
jgi:hypothetical protein